MKKQSELLRDITEMVKDTKAGKMKWDVKCQTTEFNQEEEKPTVDEEGTVWIVDECYTSFYTEFRGEEFLMITYEMIHSAGSRKKTTNLVFLPPMGIRYFDIHTLLPYAVECDQMLSYQVHMLWLTLLEEHKKHPELIALDASERKLTIEDE